MVYLLLAIICSISIPVIIRFSEGKVTNGYGMYLCNYIVCIITGLLWMGEFKPLSYGEAMKPVFIVGLFEGILYLSSLVYYDLCIKKTGLVLTSIFGKSAMIVPIIVAIVIFKNILKLSQVFGIVLCLLAIFIINYNKKSFSKIDNLGILLIAFFLNGFTDSMNVVFNELCDKGLIDYFVLYTFIFAALCAFVMTIVKKNKIGKYELIYGFAFGIPNYFSAYFLTTSLSHISPVIVYPIFYMVSLIGITLAGVLLFKEELDLKKIMAIIMVIIAMIILNI